MKVTFCRIGPFKSVVETWVMYIIFIRGPPDSNFTKILLCVLEIGAGTTVHVATVFSRGIAPVQTQG